MYTAVDKSEKMSDKIISQIRDSILSGRIKPGDKLASEKELLEQFGVSKATMREALRVLECMGLIEMRKGITGGAFVAEVDMTTTIHGIINFLHFQPVSIREITMLRYLIEPGVARIAASRLSDEDVEKLREIIASTSSNDVGSSRGISFHRYLARMTENTILILLVDFIDNLLSSIKTKIGPSSEFFDNVEEAHSMILECLIQGDSFAAEIAMANDLLDVGNYLAHAMGKEPFDPSEIYQWDPSNCPFKAYPGTKVVKEGDPDLEKRGAIAKRVGSSRLYLVTGEEEPETRNRNMIPRVSGAFFENADMEVS